MAISGAFAGLAGGDRHARLAVPTRHARHPVGARSASSASPSRCSGATPRSASLSRRCCSAALLTARRRGTSTRRLRARARRQPDLDDPGARRAVRRRRRARPLALVSAQERSEGAGSAATHERRRRAARRRQARRAGLARRLAWTGIALGPRRLLDRAAADHARARGRGPSSSALVAVGARRIGVAVRGRAPARLASRSRRRARRSPLGYLATRSGVGNLETVVVWSALIASMLRFATPLMFAAIGGMFSERSGVVNIGLEGMMLMGCLLRHPRRRQDRLVGARPARSRCSQAGCSRLSTPCFSIHLRADQIVGGTAINFLALGITGYSVIEHLRRAGHARPTSRASRTCTLRASSTASRSSERRARRSQPDDLGRASRSSSLS